MLLHVFCLASSPVYVEQEIPPWQYSYAAGCIGVSAHRDPPQCGEGWGDKLQGCFIPIAFALSLLVWMGMQL